MIRVLGIETSCDETALAIAVKDGGAVQVVKSLVASQINIHKKYGGVVPEVAARNHALLLPALLKKILGRERERAFDAIAVTAGPGLITSLRVGTDAARTLSLIWRKPLIAINHLEGHIFANWIEAEESPRFPALALIVSGGHTELVLMRRFGDYIRLGATRDDAAGEAFDKVAKILCLGYPGGPKVADEARRGNPGAIALPRPMIKSNDFDFSFSGLKTAVLLAANAKKWKRADICASFEQAVIDVLIAKSVRAAQTLNPRSFLLAGGVAANNKLRREIKKALLRRAPKVAYFEPRLEYTTDNAAIIAVAGCFAGRDHEAVWQKLEPRAQWEIGV